MKLCQVCLRESPDDAKTCPYCGHASWKALRVDKPAERVESAVSEADEPETKSRLYGAKRRKGRKS